MGLGAGDQETDLLGCEDAGWGHARARAFQKLEPPLEPLEGTQSCPLPDFGLPAPGLTCAILSH